MINKKTLITLALSLLACTAQASDFIEHRSQKPQAIPTNQIQVINFWASWCQPCRKEMPDMSKWYAKVGKKQKIFMVGIAIDSPENIQSFLKQTPVRYPIWRYTGTDSRKMMKQYGNNIGGLPYTVVRAPQCAHEEKIIGELTYQRLDQAVKNAQTACHSHSKLK